MVTVCWSVKGGVGTTVVAAGMALVAARTSPSGALLVDLGGDQPTALGLTSSGGPGVAEWLAAGPAVPPDALSRLEQPAAEGLRLLTRGSGSLPGGPRASVLAALLADERRPVVVDAGCLADPANAKAPADGSLGEVLAACSKRSWLVTTACLLALDRAQRSPARPTGVVLVSDRRRALDRTDVEGALGVPVVLDVAVDPAVARVVDAGLLATRLPRPLAAAFEQLADGEVA